MGSSLCPRELVAVPLFVGGVTSPPSSPRTPSASSGQERQAGPAEGPAGVHKELPSSAGEDRALLLGFAMMGFSAVMFFLLGTTTLKPLLLSPQREESNCTTMSTHIVDGGPDCSQGQCPCLQVFVALGHSGRSALLHYNEEAAQRNPQCFYTPKCHRDRKDLLSSALDIKEFFDHKNGTPFSCFYSPDRQPDIVLVDRCDHTAVSHCLLWPSLTLLGGALIVGMVRLTQHLSLLCEKYSPAVGPEVGGPRPHLGRHRFQPWGMRRGTGGGRALRPRPRRSAGPAGAH